MDEPLQQFQPGDVVEVTVFIRHAANLRVVKANFVHEQWRRDVTQWFNVEALLVPGEEEGTTVATFELPVQNNYAKGEYKMEMLRVDTYAGLINVLVEDSPVVRFELISERNDYLQADGFEMRKR